MNKQIITSLGISAVLVFFTLSIIMDLHLFIYDPEWRGIIKEKEQQQNERLFIVGASSVYSLNSTYISEKLFEHGLEYEIFNLADMSDTPSHRLNSVDHLISLNPDVIVYGVGITDFEIKQKDDTKNITLKDITEKNPKELFIENTNLLGEEWVKKFPTSPKEKTVLVLKYMIRGPEYIKNPFINFAETEIATIEELETYKKNIDFNKIDTSSDNHEIKSLKEIITKFENNGIKTLIFTVPYHEIVLEEVSYNEQKLFENHIENISIERYINPKFLHEKYSKMDIWRDPYHVAVNKNVKIYSEDIAQFIIEELQ